MTFERELQKLKEQYLFRHLPDADHAHGSRIRVGTRDLLLFCSNDYLGLSGHPALKNAAAAALERYGVGAGASRLVSGNTSEHRALEERIARLKGTEAALVFNSGYAANTGVIPALAGQDDLILSDELNHASIVDGCRLSKAAVRVYRHCDSDHLESLLKDSRHAHRRLIITDGVFSMDGDLAPLPELVILADRYDALLMVDDAHGTGVMGGTGRGTKEHFLIDSGIAVQMGTFSKALGSFGAYVAGSRDLIDHLVNNSRSLIFSTGLPPAICAASNAALELLDREPGIRETLWKNRARFVQGLTELGVGIGRSATPILPLRVGTAENALAASELLLDSGIYATAIRPPTVPEGSARIRMTVTAAHSLEDIEHALDAIRRVHEKGFLI